jgi:hypothetical protein
MGWMTCGVCQRDHPAKRCAQDDRLFDPEDLTECPDVIAPLRQVPALLWAILTSTIAAMIEIDDLNEIGQGRISRLVDRVIEAGATMEEQQCRLLPHGGTVRHQLGAFDIEEQAHTVHENIHHPGSGAAAARIACATLPTRVELRTSYAVALIGASVAVSRCCRRKNEA